MADTLQDFHPDLTNVNDYDKTILGWKVQLALISYVYDSILDSKHTILKRLSLVTFLITSLASLLGLLQYSVPSGMEKTITMIVTTFITVSSTVISGTIQVLGIQDLVKNYQQYYTNVENFYAEISARESLPKEMQADSKEYVTQNKDRFYQLLRDAPDIGNNEYEKYKNRYYKEMEETKTGKNGYGSIN